MPPRIAVRYLEVDVEELSFLKMTKSRVSSAAVYKYLRRPVPLSMDPSSPSEEIGLVLLYLHALAHDINEGDTPAKRISIQEFERHWVPIWSWTRALVTRYVLENQPCTKEGIECQTLLLKVFPMVVTLPSLHESTLDTSRTYTLMQRSSDLFLIIVRVLVFTLDRQHPSLTSLFKVLDIALTASELPDARGGLAQVSSERTNTIVRIPGVIESMLSYIYFALHERGESFPARELSQAFRSVGLMMTSGQDVLDTFLAHGILPCLCRSFKVLISPRRIAKLPDPEIIVESVKYIIKVFMNTLYYYSAPGCLLLIRAGLLSFTVNSWRLISFDEEAASPRTFALFEGRTLADFFIEILEPVPNMFGSRLILNSFKQAFEKLQAVDQDALDAFMQLNNPSSRNPNHRRLGDVWRDLLLQVSTMKRARVVFEARGLIVCANPEGNTRIPDFVVCAVRDVKSRSTALGSARNKTGTYTIIDRNVRIIVCQMIHIDPSRQDLYGVVS
ncbi:hypothetical protein D9758_007037 [Tetrapyrgos nigripes]|uniref:Uncharacterized protein n=1 Tax=Tetrapyrgos nigripes TaxID=182062 RepID=A0A8H5GDK3_9AGAR|nr:hypothetical protein D9758_007037 [Tetrapyrgos nigripes]